MEGIESTLSSLKQESQIKYDDLLNEEKLCEREIELFDKKIHTWLTQKNDDIKPQRVTSGRSSSARPIVDTNGTELLPEVIEFDVNIELFEFQKYNFEVLLYI
jgi:hypothetical protein